MAWNDPQWGNNNKRNDGPPDLDELFRKLKRRLAGLFGRKGPDFPDGGMPSGRQAAGGAGVLIAVAVAIWLASGFYIVDAAKRGVVLRFGKYVETTKSGLHWHLPYPLESVEVVNQDQVRTVEVGRPGKKALMLTDDENIIDIQFVVQYVLNNPEDYLFNNRNPDETVAQAAETAIREIVGKNRMDFVLYEGREEVAKQAAILLQTIIDRYKLGVTISKVTMQNAQPPEQVQAAFDDAVKAGQDKERQKNEGQAYANDVVPKARGLASRLLEEASGYKQRVIANAEGDASRFKQILVEYNKAPVVTRERLYLDAMQQILTSTTKVLVDQKGGNNLLYLPLDKLIQQVGGSAAPATVATPDGTASGGDRGALAAPRPSPSEAQPQTQAEGAYRSRDAFRSRDREERP